MSTGTCPSSFEYQKQKNVIISFFDLHLNLFHLTNKKATFPLKQKKASIEIFFIPAPNKLNVAHQLTHYAECLSYLICWVNPYHLLAYISIWLGELFMPRDFQFQLGSDSIQRFCILTSCDPCARFVCRHVN